MEAFYLAVAYTIHKVSGLAVLRDQYSLYIYSCFSLPHPVKLWFPPFWYSLKLYKTWQRDTLYFFWILLLEKSFRLPDQFSPPQLYDCSEDKVVCVVLIQCCLFFIVIISLFCVFTALWLEIFIIAHNTRTWMSYPAVTSSENFRIYTIPATSRHHLHSRIVGNRYCWYICLHFFHSTFTT